MNQFKRTGKQDYETPDWLFEYLNNEFAFDLDACASKENAKCNRYISKVSNALEQNWSDWGRSIWVNPPYGQGLYDWVKQAYWTAWMSDCRVVVLLPASTDTKWFHEFCTLGEVRFIARRLKFKGAKHTAPFASMVVIFECQNGNGGRWFKNSGKIGRSIDR